MPQIIVEDGTIVAGANSYMNVAQLRLRADFNGIDLAAATDDDLERFLIDSFRYLDSRESEFSGHVVENSQPSAWPRKNAKIKCRIEIGFDEIPGILLDAQTFLVGQLKGGLQLYKTASQLTGDERGTFTSERTLGPLTIKTNSYPSSASLDASSGASSDKRPVCIPQLEAILSPIMESSSSAGNSFPTVRT